MPPEPTSSSDGCKTPVPLAITGAALGAPVYYHIHRAAAGMIGCALSASFWQLLLARCVMGLGSALRVSLSYGSQGRGGGTGKPLPVCNEDKRLQLPRARQQIRPTAVSAPAWPADSCTPKEPRSVANSTKADPNTHEAALQTELDKCRLCRRRCVVRSST